MVSVSVLHVSAAFEVALVNTAISQQCEPPRKHPRTAMKGILSLYIEKRAHSQHRSHHLQHKRAILQHILLGKSSCALDRQGVHPVHPHTCHTNSSTTRLHAYHSQTPPIYQERWATNCIPQPGIGSDQRRGTPIQDLTPY